MDLLRRLVAQGIGSSVFLAAACSGSSSAPPSASPDAAATSAVPLDAAPDALASPDAPPRADASPPIAGSFLFGVESLSAKLDTAPSSAENQAALAVVERELRATYVKIRLTAQPTEPFTSRSCQPDCFDLDATVWLFKEKGWSMVPMISAPAGPGVTSVDVGRYVRFVEWFLTRYRDDAKVEYLELVNNPAGPGWRGTDDDLLAIQNGVYERVHAGFPGVKVGTHGVEMFADSTGPEAARQLQILELLLDGARGARFDFLAFHGYKPLGDDGPYPPTRSTLHNRFAPIEGILELRKRLDANGWGDRGLLDTESTYMSPLETLSSWGETSAALMAQSLVRKRALLSNGKPALLGALPLKVSPRCEPAGNGECGWADLAPDGAPTPAVRAVIAVQRALADASPSGHVSGTLDVDREAWVERFVRPGGREVYVAFQPFASTGRPTLDGATLSYTLDLGAPPRAITVTESDGAPRALPSAARVPLVVGYAPTFVEVDR